MLTDLKRAWRMHTARPGFTLIAVLMLAVGIGANTSVFSVASVVLLKNLPYREPGRLTAIQESRPRERVADNVVSLADFLDWREQNSVFSSVAAYDSSTFTFTGRGEPEQITGAMVSGQLFETLGASPLWGRTIQVSDESAVAGALAVLSHGFWERRFGSDPAIVGQSITLYGVPHTVIGVMPRSFAAPIRSWEVYTPMKFNANSRSARGNHFLHVIARLKPGVGIDRARGDMAVISKNLEKAYQVNTGHYANVVPLDEAMRGKTRPAMIVLLGAVGLVLLIACFNVANLLLARSVARAREISIRLAMGASRWRIVRQLLAESVALSVTGAGAGLLGALWMVGYLKTFIPAELALANEDVRIDGTVLLFSTLLALASGMFSGLAPALTASRGNVNDVLRAGGRGQTASPWRQRQRAAIVIGEMGLSVLLLIGAGLLIRSFVKLLEVNPGFRAEKLLTMTITLPDSSYKAGAKKMAFQKQLMENVTRLPGVQRAGITSFLPMTDQGGRMGLQVEGVDPDPREPRRANWRVASPGYFETMQIPLRAGRLFAESDHREAPIVMLINETAAKKYWPGRDPLGTHAKLSSMEKWATVIGVTGDVKHWGLEAPNAPEAYLSLWQAPFSLNSLVIRTQGDPARLAGQVREQLRALDKDLPPAAIRSMQDLLDESTSVRRFEMMLLTGLAAIAVLLAAAGIYAQLAYSVTQRMSEIGVRMALGARPADVVRMIIGQGLGLAGAGAIAGVAGAFALTRLLERFLFGVKALDPVTMVLAPVTLMVVAVLACMVPAWRASQADPAVALRDE